MNDNYLNLIWSMMSPWEKFKTVFCNILAITWFIWIPLILCLGLIIGLNIRNSAAVEPIKQDILFHVEEDCFMDNEGDRLQMKRLTLKDLENM